MHGFKMVPLVLLAAVVFSAAALGIDSPYSLKEAKVGDWAEYTMGAGGGKIKAEGAAMMAGMKQRKEVVAKDDEFITLRISMEMGGRKMPGQDIKIPLNKPYDPTARPGKPAGTFEKTGEGDETLTIGGKEYKCHWISGKATTEGGTSESKIWYCPDVPLGGLVKMEGAHEDMKFSTELVGAGRG